MNRLLITFAVQMFAAWLCVLGVAFYWATQTACGGGAAILGDSSVDASGVNTGRTIDRGGRANGALANARLQHPKVDLLKSEIQEFRNLKNQGAVYKDAYDWLMTYGDKAVARTTEYAYSQKGSWASDLTTCRYAYLASGDAKYAEHAKALALYAAQNWVPASGVTATRDATAEFARTYDTLYDYLSSAERSILLDATRTWGMLLYSEIQKNYKLLMGPMTANSIGYLAEAALVMDGEFAEASTWMDFCVNHYTGTIDGYSWPWYSGGDDGGLAQGLYYRVIGWTRAMGVFDKMEKLGYADMHSREAFRNMGESFLYLLPPNAPFYGTFGDGGQSCHLISEAFAQRFEMMWLSSICQDPEYRWWATTKLVEGKAPPSDPLSWRGLQYQYQTLLLGLRETKSPVSASPPSRPNSKLFANSGYASMHTNLANPADDVVLNVRCAPYPYGAVHHAHPDQNSFVFYYHGEPLAINAGHYGGTANISWDGPYMTYYARQTKSKNAILIDDIGQKSGSATATGEILRFEDAADYTYFVGDAVQAYNDNQKGLANAVKRHVAMIHQAGQRPFVVMLDEVDMPSAHKLKWLLHTMKQATVDEAGQSITLRYDTARARVKLLASEALTISQTDQTDPPLDPGNTVAANIARLGESWHLTAETSSAKTSFRIGTVLFPYEAGAEGDVPVIDGYTAPNNRFVFVVGANTITLDLSSMSLSIMTGQTPG